MRCHLVLATVFVVAKIVCGYPWRVKVHTGTVSLVGSNRIVHVALVDRTGRRSYLMLLKNRWDSKHGIETFQVDYNLIQNLDAIRVLYRGDDGWFLNYVEIVKVSQPDITYYFECHCWFKNKEKKEIRLLAPGIKPSCEWEVRVMTGRQKQAETDNLVYLEVYGNSTWSTRYRLNDGADEVQRASVNVLDIQMKCFNPEKIKLTIEGSDGWFPYWFDFIRKDDPSLKYMFPCYDWLDDNGTLVFDILDPTRYQFCDWVVHTFTGREPEAGTDDAAYIELEESGKTSTSFYELAIKKDELDLGHRDEFRFQSRCLAPDRVVLSLKGKDGWYLEHIEMWTIADPGTKYTFACHCWLYDRNRRPANILPPGSKITCEWIVKTLTGSAPKADSNDDAYILLIGNVTSTSFHKLDSDKNDFEMGKTDEFTIRSFCKKPDRIRVMLKGRDNWHLMTVELQRKDDMNTTYVFPCHCWLVNNGNKYVDVLPPGSKATCDWSVTVSTGFEKYAGTDDDVFMQLFGNGISTSYYRLNTNKNDFELGNTDVFEIKSFCYTPDKIRMKIGGQNDWYLMLVTLRRKDAMGTKYVFPCHCWLDNIGAKYVDVMTPGSQATCDWVAKVSTSNTKYADTDDVMRIMIVGDSIFHTTSYHRLTPAHGYLGVGATDRIKFKSKCLIPKAIKLKHGGDNGWKLDTVELQRTSNEGTGVYIFNCNCWLDDKGFKYIYL